MKKILFVCHGNICRSPMAEFVMKDLVKKAGLASQFQIESAATSREEIGNPVYPPARRKLAEHGISCGGHAARQLTNRDYEEYDLLIGMDRANLRDMHRICGGDFAGKLHLLMDYTDHPRDVADPWYTEDFEATWQDVLVGCQGLMRELTEGKKCYQTRWCKSATDLQTNLSSKISFYLTKSNGYRITNGGENHGYLR